MGNNTQEFLTEGGHRCLRVTKFKPDDEAGKAFRKEYSQLIEVLPQCAIEKLGEETLSEVQHRYQCLTQLTKKHSG